MGLLILKNISFLFLFISFIHVDTFELYKDGVHNSGAFVFEENIILNSIRPYPLDMEHIFNSSEPLLDVQYSGSNYMFVLLGDQLKLVYMYLYDLPVQIDIYSSTVLNPIVLDFDEYVNTISGYSIGFSYHYVYIRNDYDLCFGALYENMELNDQPEVECIVNAFEEKMTKLDLYSSSDLYALDDQGRISKVTIMGTSITQEVLPRNGVRMLAYPAILEGGTDVYHLIEDTYISFPDKASVYVVSNKTDLSFVVQYDDGSIIGFGFVNKHPSFQSECPIISSEYCNATSATSLIPGIVVTSENIVVFKDETTLEFHGSFTDSLEVEGNYSDRIYVAPSNDGSAMFFLSGTDGTAAYNVISNASLFYMMHHVESDYKHVASLSMWNVLKYFVCIDGYFYHLNNGSLILNFKNDVVEIQSNVKECYFGLYFPSVIVCHNGVDKITLNDRVRTIKELHTPIKELACTNLLCNFVAAHVDDTLYLYEQKDEIFEPVQQFKNVDDFKSNMVFSVIKVGNEFYCPDFSYKCCRLDYDSENIYQVEEDLGTRGILYPIDKGDMADKEVEKFIITYENMYFLTKDGEVYTCMLESGGDMRRNGEEREERENREDRDNREDRENREDRDNFNRSYFDDPLDLPILILEYLDSHAFPLLDSDLLNASVLSNLDPVLLDSLYSHLLLSETTGTERSHKGYPSRYSSHSMYQSSSRSSSRTRYINGLVQDQILDGIAICDIVGSQQSYNLYMIGCNGKTYTYFGRPNKGYALHPNGTFESIYELEKVYELEEAPKGVKLLNVFGIVYGNYLLYESMTCKSDICTLEQVHFQNETIVMPKSQTIVISKSSQIEDSILIVDSGTTFVVEDVLSINSSSIEYIISDEGRYLEIQNKESIRLFTTTNTTSSRIDGSFDEIRILLDGVVEKECRIIKGDLVQESKHISVVFKVEDSCNPSFPIWAIILIVIGAILVVAIVTLLVLKKRLFLSRFDSKGMPKRDNFRKSDVYKSSGSAKKSPIFTS